MQEVASIVDMNGNFDKNEQNHVQPNLVAVLKCFVYAHSFLF